MPNHRIRLAGPWESQTVDGHQSPTGETVRCQLPYTLFEARHEFEVQLRRGFHHPTGIDNETTLRIVLQASESPAAVRVNGKEIEECAASLDGESAFDVTGRIEAFNELCIVFRFRDDVPTAMLKSVWLEIQSPDSRTHQGFT